MIGGKIVKEAGHFINPRIAMAVFSGAAVAGVAAAHPLRPISEAFQEEMYGDKDAIQKTVSAAAITGIRDAFARTPTDKEKIDKLYEPSATNGHRGNVLYGSAEGSLVFGLYNNRLGG